MNKILWKKIHNIFGLSSAIFLVVLLITGIALNHPQLYREKRIEALAMDPENPQKIYSGTTEGLFYSVDGGKNWEEVPMLYPPQEVVDIAFSPNNSREIYVLEKWGKIFNSMDGGKIWTTLNLPFDPQSEGIELKQISVGAGGLALLTSNGWIYSTQEGKNWDLRQFNKNKRTLSRLILTLHNGYFFGPMFVWLYDFSALALFILIVSGLFLWNIGKKTG